MDILHIKQLLYYRRHSLHGLELHEKSDWRATALHTHCGHSLIQYCRVYIARPYIYCFGVQLRVTTKLTWLMTVLHTKREVYCQRCIVLEEQIWLATLYTLQFLSNYNGRYKYMYANVKINKEYYRTS